MMRCLEEDNRQMSRCANLQMCKCDNDRWLNRIVTVEEPALGGAEDDSSHKGGKIKTNILLKKGSTN